MSVPSGARMRSRNCPVSMVGKISVPSREPTSPMIANDTARYVATRTQRKRTILASSRS